MKKRLRKKKHLGEFQEFAVKIYVSFEDMEAETFINFLDAFMKDAIEANGCHCGGGDAGEAYSFYVELGKDFKVCEAKLEKILSWLESRTEVEEATAGAIHDSWYGPFDEEVLEVIDMG